MANFNDRINWETGHVLCDRDYYIYRSDSINVFKQLIEDDLFFRRNAYRLCIQYKDTHPVESVAGQCCMWNGDRNGVEVVRVGRDDNDDFGDPGFDAMAGAIFITDKYVVTYGDTWIKAVDLEEKHVVCNAYVCGRQVSQFRIPADVFDRLFGLKENFPEQCAKTVKVEMLQREKIYDAYEIACLMDSNRLCSDLLSSLLRLNSVISSHGNVYDKSQVARKAVEDLAIELGISIRNIEDGLK